MIKSFCLGKINKSHSESIDDGGYGYYEIIGSSQNKTILENFMSSGGTLQVHLQENEQHYQIFNSYR